MSMSCASGDEICFEGDHADAVLLLGRFLDDERWLAQDEEPLSSRGRVIVEDAILYLWDRQGSWRDGQSRGVHCWRSDAIGFRPCDCDVCRTGKRSDEFPEAHIFESAPVGVYRINLPKGCSGFKVTVDEWRFWSDDREALA
jgi:hypothetical protein